MGVDFAQLGWKGNVAVRDLWKREDVGVFRKRYARRIAAHGAVLLKVVIQ